VAIAEVPLDRGEAEADVRERILSLPDRFRPDAAAGFAAEFALQIDLDHYRVAIADGRCAVSEEDPPVPTARITTDAGTWLELDAGSLTSIDAFLDDRITVRGNVDHAVRMQSLFRPFARERTPQDLEHVTIRAGGNRLSTFLFGQGPPVVLLHGLGATKLSYLPLLPALARHHTVVVPDLPGHGESTKPRAADYTPQYFAYVILELMDRLGAERAAIVGNSMGGRIALEIAGEAPDRVPALVLLDPAAAGLPFPLFARLLGMLPTGVGAVPIPLRKRIVMAAMRQLFADPRRLPGAAYLAGADEFVRIYRMGSARVALLAAIRGLVADPDGPFWERVASYPGRALILWGSEDRLVPLRMGRRLAATMRHAELVVLPGVGHVPQFEVPDETRSLVLSFLDRTLGPRVIPGGAEPGSTLPAAGSARS
jgi:pimeloyl-ACP methyl ester carboxylesterase/putative sterol carrier protein